MHKNKCDTATAATGGTSCGGMGLAKFKGVKVHFYQHNIGDFNNATRHLSRLERSIYRDLLEHYYSTEKPLIADVERLARLCLVDENDRGAMRDVLNEYFLLQEDG